MIKIGVFSQLAQVSIRTLRHYDEVGLLKPEFIEPATNYRYYTLEQLPRLNRILALKDLGLTLEQILQWLDKELNAEDLRQMLRHKQEELTQQIELSHRQLNTIEAHLWQIEQEEKPSGYEIVLKSVPACRIASLREIIPSLDDMATYRCRMFEQLYAELAQHHFVSKQELVLYHTQEYTEVHLDVETAVMIEQENQIKDPMENISIYDLSDEALVASVVHDGRLEQLGFTIAALFKWVALHGFAPTGPVREIHLYGQECLYAGNPTIIVELQIPVAKNA